MKRLITLFALGLALSVVPLAAAFSQDQANLISEDSIGIQNARGVQATVGVQPVSFPSIQFVYSYVRLTDGVNQVQIGWQKTGNLNNWVDDCESPSSTYVGVFVETVVNGSYHCTRFDTPTGYTWGQAVPMTVKYLGTAGGSDPNSGDFEATFDNSTTVSLPDVGWQPTTTVEAVVGGEFIGDTPPDLFKTTFSGFSYQPMSGGSGDSFVLAGSSSFFDNTSWDHTFDPSTGSGTITYPAGGPIWLDDFNRADANPIGSPYTTWGGYAPMKIVSNQVTESNPGLYVYNAMQYPGNYTDVNFSVKIATQGSSHEAIRYWARADNGNGDIFFCYYPYNDTIYLSGVTSPITNFPHVYTVVGDRIGLRVIGSSVQITVNGVVQTSYVRTTTNLSAGHVVVGLMSEWNTGTLKLDDLQLLNS